MTNRTIMIEQKSKRHINVANNIKVTILEHQIHTRSIRDNVTVSVFLSISVPVVRIKDMNIPLKMLRKLVELKLPIS